MLLSAAIRHSSSLYSKLNCHNSHNVVLATSPCLDQLLVWLALTCSLLYVKAWRGISLSGMPS